MEFPSSQAESPSSLRGIAGPSRARLQARQHRNSNLKPYDRRSLIADSSRTRTDSLLSFSAISAKSGKSKADQDSIKNGSVGLLSGLRQALFSRSLSWLSGTGAKSINTTLPSHATLSAAQRLAASVQGSKGASDIESHINGIAGKQKQVAPPLSTPRNTIQTPSTILNSTHNARSSSPARSSASAAIQSHGRQRLLVGPVPHSPKFGGSTLGTPGYRRGGSLRPDGGSMSGIAASQSSPSYAFGFGSERRMAGINSAASAYNLISPSPLASSSHNPLPSRSPFAMSRQSYAGSSAGGSNVGAMRTLGTPSRSRPTSMFGGEMNRSRAESIADSRMSITSQTPKRREWSSLKLAPPKADFSAGEELMQAYFAMRNGAGDSGHSPGHSAFLQNGANTDTLMMEFGAGPSMNTSLLRDEGSLKRGVDMSVDGDEMYSEATPRKKQKQMVWDAEMGFVSKEELRAKRPSKPMAQNEAERLLNALEGMRSSPMVGGSNSRRGTPSRQMMSVPVPLPVPERSDLNGGARRLKVEHLSKTVSPYSRAMRSRLSQSVEPEEGKGLKARLRKPVRASSRASSPEKKKGGEDIQLDESMDHEDVGGEDGQSSIRSEEMEEDDDDIVEPLRRKLGSSISTAKKDKTKTLRSGKVLPPSPLKPAVVATPLNPSKLRSSLAQPSKPMSKARLEISASGTSAANKQRATQQEPLPVSEPKARSANKESVSHFQILSDPPSERTRSSLRQGAEKTHRSHVKSGRVGLDDEDDDETDDLPSAEELNKIKLPTNLFPQGFTFSGASSTSFSSNGASPSFNSPALSLAVEGDKSEESSKTQANEATPLSNSLFDRLGSFAPPSQTEPAKSPAPSFSFGAPAKSSDQPASKSFNRFETASSNEASKSAAPSFSFGAPAKISEPSESASKPLFSFQTGATSLEAKKIDVPTFSISTPPKASDVEVPASKPFLSFQSSTSIEESKAATSPFLFGAPASKESEPVVAAAAKPTFNFGAAPSTEASKPSTPSFSFGGSTKVGESSVPAATPSMTLPSTTSTEANKEGPSGFSFDAPAKTSESAVPASKPLFSFGSSTESSKVETPSFSFNSSPSKEPEPSKSPFGFSSPTKSSTAGASKFFSAPNADTKEASATTSTSSSTKSDGPIPNFFASSLAKTSQPSFSFNSSSPTKPESAPTSAPSVTFGSNGGGGNLFGQPSTNTTTSFGSSAPAPNNLPSTNTNLFGGAAPSSSSQTSTPFGNAATSSTPSVAGFGSNGFNTSAGDNSRQGSPAPFGFGSTNNVTTQPMSGGFGGGGFGQSQAPSSTPSTPAFTFGAPSASPAPASPAAATNSGFNFSMPTVGNNGNNNSFMSSNGANPGQASPFVFGSAGTSTPPVSQAGASGFNFNMGSPATAPQSPNGGSGSANLFNMGAAPPPGSGGNRPVRGMPSRRKR